MVSVQKVVIDANNLVNDLYPAVRERLQKDIPFLDEHFGNRLADQSLRHVVHRITGARSSGEFTGKLPVGEAIFLERQLGHVDVNLGQGRGYYFQILVKAQEFALEEVLRLESRDGLEITGQTP